jgi:type 1 glutamine amidotransferase
MKLSQHVRALTTRLISPALVATALAVSPLAVDSALAQPGPGGAAQQPSKLKVVFLAGPKEHGSPGRHEYEKDLRELAWMLENATNIPNLEIETQVMVGRPPRDLSYLDGVDLIVMHSNGDWLPNETGLFFPQAAEHDFISYDAETTAYLRALQNKIRDEQIGTMMFHYTMWIENRAGRNILDNWFGGVWIPYLSQNPVDTWSVSVLAPQHQILRGVETWTMQEEMYSRYFLPYNPGRTDLLLGTPTNNRNGPQVIAFANERLDGGRGFVYGGLDFHENMHLYQGLRTFLVNAMLWTAGKQVPQGGVQMPAPPEL